MAYKQVRSFDPQKMGTRKGYCLMNTRLGFDINWQFAEHLSLFAKVYWCHIIDHDLRHACETGSGNDYGQYKDFAWGGVGLAWNF